MPKQLKMAARTSDKSGVDDGLMTRLLVVVNDTHTTNQRRNPRRAPRKSNVACTKNKSPVALPPSPEDVKRKRPPEELIEEDQGKQKISTLWSRGKQKSDNYSSEDGDRKHPPKELIDKDQQKHPPKEIPVLVIGPIYSDDDD
jgi:hypothetical protein